MNTAIFRKYDIRGIASEDLSDEVVLAIGRAYGSMLLEENPEARAVGIGFDARDSSTRLMRALSEGIHACGLDVLELGMVPTPLVYFANHTLDQLHGVIQITGSHNPAEYNGFKMMIGKGTLHGEHIQQLRQRIEDEHFHLADEQGSTSSIEDLPQRYIEWVHDNLEPQTRALKVVIDSGNGVAGIVAPDLLHACFPNCEIHSIYEEPDARFPNHHPDPTVAENLADLILAVKEQQADLGVAYDGDGDRIGVVDENGEIIWGDRLLILLARDVLKHNPGATIIGEVKCSQTLFDDIESHGGEPIMSAVGHSLIKAAIKETGAKLAGEMSGHIFFNDRFFGFDDALYTTCRLLEILSKTDDSLSQTMADVPTTFATPELRIDCPESIKFTIPGKIADKLAEKHEVNTIDGVRVRFENGWGLVRASNTQPVLVLRVEADNEHDRDAYLARLKHEIREARQQLEG